MKQISVAIWYTKGQHMEQETMTALEKFLGVDLFLSAHPDNELDHTQYPFLEIKTFEIPNK